MEWAVEAVEVHRRPLLHGVSFGAPARAVTAVVGGDVQRRTTLFRMAAGLEPVDYGAMLVLGHDIARARRRARVRLQRRLGVIFGGPEQALFADGTAWENVELAVRTAGRVGRAGVDAAIESALDAVALAHVGGERPASLSPAQRRRLAFARALVLHPPLLLADGVDDDGDPGEALRLGALVASQCRRRGSSALLFLGDAGLAAQIADVVIDLDAGDPEADRPGGGQSSTALMRR